MHGATHHCWQKQLPLLRNLSTWPHARARSRHGAVLPGAVAASRLLQGLTMLRGKEVPGQTAMSSRPPPSAITWHQLLSPAATAPSASQACRGLKSHRKQRPHPRLSHRTPTGELAGPQTQPGSSEVRRLGRGGRGACYICAHACSLRRAGAGEMASQRNALGPKAHLLGENKSGEWDQPAAGWE